MKRILSITLILLSTLFFTACNSSTVDEALETIKDPDGALDLIEGVDRRPINLARFGLNAFSNQGFAGTICSQFSEIKNTLGITAVRVLFNWDDNVQPTPNSSLNFSFYDDILDCIPSGMTALVILMETPSWMSDPSRWDGGNPRLTFANRWARVVASRYAGHPRISGYQIWNEPNNAGFPANERLSVLQEPINFVELTSFASDAIRAEDPTKLIISGATTSIAQNYPSALNYNKMLVEAGLLSLVDIYGIHYYGTNFERLIGEVDDFLNSVSLPIWVTETGKTGVNNQLEYAERTLPFLRERVNGIDRIFWYRFAENRPANESFGLRTPDPDFPVSDLYIYLANS